jgi:CTP synthase
MFPESHRQKIALFTNVKPEAVIPAIDVETIYEVPLTLHHHKLDEIVIKKLALSPLPQPDLSDWQQVVERFKHPTRSISIGIVGKYVELQDAYKSLIEALIHAGIQTDTRVNINYIDSEKFETNEQTPRILLKNYRGILIPGGFGTRGIEGKIKAVRYARENRVPFLGICLGMQVALIEFARHVAGMSKANSTEFDPKTPYPIVGLITEWQDQTGKIEKRDHQSDLGGTMRLGGQICVLKENSLARKIYKKARIVERHRHRYEANQMLFPQLEEKGLTISGKSEDKQLIEMIELQNHPWFVGCQFHPEFTSNPREGHPLFAAFVQAALEVAENEKTASHIAIDTAKGMN